MYTCSAVIYIYIHTHSIDLYVQFKSLIFPAFQAMMNPWAQFQKF